MQLATKPHVVLTRQPLYRKCGLKNLENERENKIVDNCRMIDVQKLNNIEWIVEQGDKHIKKTNSVKVYEDSLIKNNRELFIDGCKVEIPLTTFHSFDKALEQFDKLVSSKMNMHEKLSNRRASVIVSTDSVIKSQNNTFSSKKFNKNENYFTYIENKNSRIQKITNLISDKIDRVPATKKIDIKLNLKSSSDKKENNCVKSESYKVLNTYYIKSHINKKLCNDKKTMDVKVNNISSKNKYSIDYKIEENAKKRTVYEPVTSDSTQRKKIRTSIDEHKEINRKKRKKLKNKFRAYFGECITISEDEQEQTILQNRFKRKRKKDSADSSDSGVYIADKSTSLQIIKDIQKTISNSIICGKFNENLSGETIINANIDYESKVIDNESTKTIDSIENKKISKIKQDIYGKIIANANINNESKQVIDKESIKTIDSIEDRKISKIKQDVSGKIIANVNIDELKTVINNESIKIIDSIEDKKELKVRQVIFAETIANANISNKSKEIIDNKNIKTIDLVEDRKELKFRQDVFTETIANINIDNESKKIIDNENIKTIDSVESKKGLKSGQDVFEETIRNVNTTNESKEIIDNKSTKTIDSVLKIKQDMSESIHLAIANVNINNELKEVSSNETINSIESLINMEIENNELQIIQIKKNNISQEKLINTDRDNIIPNKHRLSVIQSNDRSNIDIPQITKEIESNASLKKVEIKTGNTTLSSDIFCSTNDTINIIEDFSELQNCNLNIKDFNDLLYMDITETCQITSNGNVLSIQETIEEVMNKNIDENSNLNNLSETQIDCNQDVKKTISNCIEENNNKDLNKMQSSNTNTNDRIISINNMYNVPKKENELPVAEFKLNILEKKNIQSNNLSQGRLRVLSSAELGSRWCPTPINTVMSTVSQFSHSTPHFTNATTFNKVNLDNTIVVSTSMTQIVPTTISSITTSALTAINETTISENMRKNNIDHKFSKSIYFIFVNIRDLIQKRRMCLNTNLNVNYDKLLFIEFEKLKKILNIEDYIDLIDGVLIILNKEMLVMPLLSLGELFHYTPLIESFYIHSSNKRKTVNNSSECQIITPVIVSNQITSNQNRYSNPQVSQNACVTSMHSTLQHVFPVNQNQTSTNVTLKQSYQNSQGKIILQSQNNSFQNNMPINSTAINNHNIHQHNYNMQMHKISQQKIPNSYFVQQKPVTNIYTMQNLPVQHSSFSSNINQPGDRQISLSNSQFINQQYVPQNVFTSQKNTFYNVNVPNYPIQQNRNSTHIQNIVMSPVTQQYQNPKHQQNVYSISQDIQPQTIPRHISSNYNIQQSVQPIFAMNVSYNELKHRKMPQKISMETLQNHISEQVSSSQKQHKKTKSISKKKDLQISLESTTKLFNVLKYISDIQKIILLKQIDFYFSCTTWLQQQFTSGQWQKINSQRSLLLNFQTLLKHLIEKTVKGFLPDKSQGNIFETNILKNIKIDVPKMVQIVVNENEGMYCQIEVSKAFQEQNKIMNIKQNCVTHQENLTQNQYEKEYEATNNLQSKEVSNEKQKSEISHKEVQNKTFGKRILIQKDNSPVKSSLQICETSEIVIHQENKIEEESNNSKDTYNLNIKEQNLRVPGKIIENISQIIEEKTSVLSNMKLPNNDILQLNQHLVTVEISSNNDQVTVIDTNASNESKSKNEESTEYEELQNKLQKELHISSSSLENTNYNILAISSPKVVNNMKDFDNEDLDNSSLEETITSHIEDIRSISLETFEKMEETNNIISTTDGNIEEEEIKICLFCGKPSTVACSICLEAKYCSKECFEQHWEDHYKDCTPVKKRVYN
ncbi:protein PF14_0175-like isoform X3 [Apis laboriosa]|nr:protein PF14_0175-like isoform X3 [Apis laboriosa]